MGPYTTNVYNDYILLLSVVYINGVSGAKQSPIKAEVVEIHNAVGGEIFQQSFCPNE